MLAGLPASLTLRLRKPKVDNIVELGYKLLLEADHCINHMSKHMETGQNSPAPQTRIPIRTGLFAGSLLEPERLRLAGTVCATCGETALGVNKLCANCGRDSVREIALGEAGTLWSFTVIRHRPPGNYKGPDPFKPFGVGLIELPQGLRVMSTIECPVEDLRIGMRLLFKPYLRKEQDGREVVAFRFQPPEAGDEHV
ncbi:MAG TPA: OB-fold domain-containing protein [Methylomirabilota bacterium]|nr:OB-fold domain-containing protein [Methylomirabilota bacterium]